MISNTFYNARIFRGKLISRKILVQSRVNITMHYTGRSPRKQRENSSGENRENLRGDKKGERNQGGFKGR